MNDCKVTLPMKKEVGRISAKEKEGYNHMVMFCTYRINTMITGWYSKPCNSHWRKQEKSIELVYPLKGS